MKNSNLQDSKRRPVDCYQCRHFYVTWEAANPRGCKAFRFKTHKLPSVVVEETSGEPCLKFSPKREATQKKPEKRGWKA